MIKLIYATAAESGGALTVLNNFYEEAVKSENKTIFIISKPKLKSYKNVKILRYPWIKKTWFLRLFFYWFKLPKVIKSLGVTEVLSLNNTKISRIKLTQTIYLHQPLPFFRTRLNPFKDTYLWITKYIIGFFY